MISRATSILSRVLLFGTVVVATGTPLAAQPSVGRGFEPVISRLRDRPATQVETDNYVYGPDTGFAEPELSFTIQDNSYSGPVTLYVYWHNRLDGRRLFLNVYEGGLTSMERDLFGRRGRPRRINAESLDDFKLFGEGGAFGDPEVPTTTGRYQFVMELRDAQGRQVIARSNTFYNFVDGVEVLDENVAGMTLSADNAYRLDSEVTVEDGTLTVEAGTVVMGSTDGALVVEQSGAIDAVGRPLDPIIFTSHLPTAEREPGNWRGLILNGEAPTNQDESFPIGGDDPDHSSGSLEYTRVEYGGRGPAAVALRGVGRGTTIDHLQVHSPSGAGVEIEGGTVDAKYVYVSAAEDESFRWAFGWVGRLQYLVVNQCGAESHGRGIIGENADFPEDAEPISNPAIRNATLVGDAGIADEGSNDDGVRFSRGTQGRIDNAVFFEFPGVGVSVAEDSTEDNLARMTLTVNTTIIFDNLQGASDFDGSLGTDVFTEDDPNFLNDPRGRPNCGVTPDLTFTNRVGDGTRGDGFFDPAPFIGAVDPERPWINEGFLTFSDARQQ